MTIGWSWRSAGIGSRARLRARRRGRFAIAEQPTLDAEQLLRALSDHEVDYVLIGRVASQAYGHVRTIVDLDVIAAWTPHRLAGALGALRAPLRGVDADLLGIDLTDARQLQEGGNFLMRAAHGDLNVFAVEQTPGSDRSYERLAGRATRSTSRGEAAGC